jgi:uncharacterized protein
MAYYSNSIEEFINDVNSNKIFSILNKYEDYQSSENKSWRKSLPELVKVLSFLNNKNTLFIFIEYHMKFIDKRIDVLLVGKNCSIVIELKQWTIKESKSNFIIPSYKNEEFIHPTLQAKEYSQALSDFFYGKKKINSLFCSYLHNIVNEEQDLLLRKNKRLSPYSFSNYSKSELINFLNEELKSIDIVKSKTSGLLKCLFKKNLIPTPSIIEYISNLLSKDDFSINILDKQRTFYTKVFNYKNSINNIFILDGKAGSGKTVVGYKILLELINYKKNAIMTIPSSFLYHTTKNSKLPTIHPYTIGNNQHQYDFIIVDEAHRLTKKDFINLLNKSANLVILIDDYQKVTATGLSKKTISEITPSTYTIHTEELKYQLRSNGKNNYERWVYSLFTNNPILFENTLDFEIKIFDEVFEFERILKEKQNKKMIAGFTWDWNEQNKDGSLPLDIVIDNWTKPWNNKALLDSKKYKDFYKDDTLNEVACIYTAQGVEYDYIGLIIGYDLDYKNNQFVYYPIKNKEKNMTEETIRNTYITLMTRAKKAIYIYSVNKQVSIELKKLIQ